MSAFVPSTLPLRQNIKPFRNALGRRSEKQCGMRHTPQMITAPILATELVTISVIAGGAYWGFLREKPEPTTTSKTSTRSGPIVGLQGPKQQSDTDSSSKSDSSSESSTATQHAPSPYLIETVGVDINDFLDETEGSERKLQSDRIHKELEWCVASLLDLADCHAVAVVDAENKIVSSGGSLITDTSHCGPIPARVAAAGLREVSNVTENTNLPFVDTEVRSYACLPVADSGATVVMASKDGEFLDDRELRVATAVCNRLASFSFATPSLPK